MISSAMLTTSPAALANGSSSGAGTTDLALLMVAGVVVAAVALYLLPSIVAASRHAPNIGSVVAINVLLGWSFAGWVAAFALALHRTRPTPPRSWEASSATFVSLAPGWHPDPLRADRLRFFDGTRWSDDTVGAPAPPA